MGIKIDVLDPTTYPAQPQGLSVVNSATASGGTSYMATSSLGWQVNIEPDISYYRIYKATTTGSEPGINDYTLVADNITGTSKNITITDFGDNLKIYYRITAVDAEGKESVPSESNWDWAPPTAPTGLTSGEENDDVRISWDAKNFTDGNALYDVWRKSPGKISFWSKIASNITNNYYVDDDFSPYDLPGAKEYVKYKVTAERANTNLVSDYSAELKVAIDWYYTEEKKSAESEDKPKVFSLGQNYPNPFNPTTRIKYQLPKESNVVIKLYDMLAREIVVLVNEEQEAGYYELTIDGSQLSSGTYIYKITAGEFSDSKKLLLVK